jgi:hypothetical protein
MLASVAHRAKTELLAQSLGVSALASINTLTSVHAVRRMDEINIANLEGHQVLVQEPAIARVVVLDENQNERTYYICRAAPVAGVSGLLGSYKAPVGRWPRCRSVRNSVCRMARWWKSSNEPGFDQL